MKIMGPRMVAAAIIRLYQRTLSPDHGPLHTLFPFGYCKFQPTCSQYGHDAVMKYGIVRGSARALWRIARCNPFSRGGNDPV